MNQEFDKNCKQCIRLSSFLDVIRKTYPHYYAHPVAAIGDKNPRLLIVGLAPGMHGANATGRPFTGDYAGILLYQTLYDFGFSNQAHSSHCEDGLILKDCRITNAVKCLPPDNKPMGEEVRRCNRYLRAELTVLKGGAVILALGTVAHGAILRALDLRLKKYPFGHGNEYTLPGGNYLINSYHCSRYNTQTGRLTETMFRQVFIQIRHRLVG